ncbi:unnamed protein product [Schistocephalus solidus]|uniref:C2H2-type domain-containing protein n=1 Tax=Schistocephalus solidus TaxID=70667 RepID=A0A183SRW0_SCHSO|nr:unnamed protein product [Schistocephalus solidus]
MLLWPPLTGTQVSPVAPQSWVLPSGPTPGNRRDRRAKQGKGLGCCVCLNTRRPRLADHKISGHKIQKNNNTPRPNPPHHTPQAARVRPHTIAAWNVHFLLKNPRSNRLERRTALVARELARYKVDIAALSETQFSEQGQLEENLFIYIRIHDSGIHRNDDNTLTPCTPSATAMLTTTATPTTMNDIPPASTDFSCPHCTRNFHSRIGLVNHLRIHRMETGEPVYGLQHTVDAPASTALTAPAHLHTEWAF